ncbi:hypothetical protein [Enterovibrio baiacu]|uniref:hypothetical protein n=1 Tax=Enterovibrio baiacu TaxID=2491023 RepID=UPI003D0FC4EF
MLKKLDHNVPELAQHKYSNEKFEGLEIDLGFKNAVHVFQNCVFENCCIRINSNSSATPNILNTNRFVNCTLWPGRKLSLATVEADFEGCSFKGKWSGRIRGIVEKCDFSEAELEMFTFFNQKEIGNNKFSDNDLVVIENVGEHKQEIKNALGEKSKIWIHIRPNMGLFIFNIKQHKDSAVLQSLLPGLPFVKMAKNA